MSLYLITKHSEIVSNISVVRLYKRDLIQFRSQLNDFHIKEVTQINGQNILLVSSNYKFINVRDLQHRQPVGSDLRSDSKKICLILNHYLVYVGTRISFWR